MKCFCAMCVALLVTAGVVFASSDIVLDGGNTNYFANATRWTNILDITVGNTTHGNKLDVKNGSYISNRNVFVGIQAGSSTNAIRVDGSTWDMTGDLTVGVTGSVNRLDIANGAWVSGQNAYVGAEAGANNNRATVSGVESGINSIWRLRDTLHVGAAGNSGNSVTVSNGGVVVASNLTISANNDFNLDEGGTLSLSTLDAAQAGFHWNNESTLQVTENLSGLSAVDGSGKELDLFGAEWSVGTNLTISGVSNSIQIATGSQIDSDGALIGGTASKNNSVWLYGEDTVWNVNGSLSVDGGISNALKISQAAVVNSSAGSVGGSGGEGSQVFLSDAGSQWNITNELSVGVGGSNSLLVVNGGAMLESERGTIGGGSSLSNTVAITDSDSMWRLSGGVLDVQGEANRLIVQTNGWIVVGDADPESISSAPGGVLVASTQPNAYLTVANGASVRAVQGMYVGTDATHTGTVSVVNGGTLAAGSVAIAENSALNLEQGGTLEMLGNFDAGMGGFFWNDGGHLQVESGFLSGIATTNVAGDYYARIDDYDKVLTIGESGIWEVKRSILSINLAVGWEGGGTNALIITNGGVVSCDNAFIGYNSAGNSALVAGTNSSFELDDTLYVGWNNGISNTVTIRDSGSISTENIVITNGNTLVLGQDGILDISGDFIVEGHGANFQWNSGALQLSGILEWSGNLDKTNQTLTLQGENASWRDRSTNDLVIGEAGSGNALQILDGATVSNINASVGQLDTAFSNSVLVSGVDSSWVNTGTLTIGTVANSNNMVTVGFGGTVQADAVTINDDNAFNLNSGGTLDVLGNFDPTKSGFAWDSDSTLIVHGDLEALSSLGGTNRTLVLDEGTWDRSGSDLIIGSEGRDNHVIVTNGQIMSQTGIIGKLDDNNNTVTIQGETGAWMNSGTLTIGEDADSNKLIVEKGGLVDSPSIEVGALGAENGLIVGTNGLLTSGTVAIGGDARSAFGNYLTVSGSNAVASISGDLVLGQNGDENLLTVSKGGSLTNANATLGANRSADNNTATIGGGTNSAWVNHGLLTIGDIGNHGNKVSVSTFGFVQVDDLSIHGDNHFYLISDEGTLHFATTNALDLSRTDLENLHWKSGGNLSLSGELQGMATTNLVVADGVTKTFGFLDGGRQLTLDGSGASWNNENLIMGFGSGSTRLVLTNGGSVKQATTYIGWQNSGWNAVEVASNSLMTSTSNLYVGVYHDNDGSERNAGGGNSLSVSNGGWVLVGDVSVGDFSTSDYGIAVAATNGAELVVGYNSGVFAESGLLVGLDTSRTGTVTVQDFGVVDVGTIDVVNGSRFNLKEDGTLKVRGDFDVAGQQNVVWLNGGHLSVGGALTGFDGLHGTNQTLSIDGGSWDLGTSDLVVGSAGDDNELNILNGGVVVVTNAFVGEASDWNVVFVSGSNSLWNVQGTLNIGSSINIGNAVKVENNGVVRAISLNIATNDTFNPNMFLLNTGGTLEMQDDFDISAVNHKGLQWNPAGNLAVKGALTGMPGTNLFNGAMVHLSQERYLTLLDGGNWDAGTNNLIVGYGGNNSKLTISGNASVMNQNGYIGWGSSVNNEVVVEGPESVWQNNENLHIGAFPAEGSDELIVGSRNYLTVSNGGWVLVGNFDTNGLSGGVGVAGTNVIGNGLLSAYDGIYVGDGSRTGLVSVLSRGAVLASNLVINAGGTFDLAGRLDLVGDFDASQAGTFNWNDGGNISITNGILSGISEISGTNKTLVVNDSTWITGNLLVDGLSNTIRVVSSGTNLFGMVTNNGSVTIGSLEGSGGNRISIANSNSIWTTTGDFRVGANNTLSATNSGELSVGGSLSLMNGTIFNMDTSAAVSVGDDMTISNAVLSGAGTIAFDDGANILSIAGANTMIDPDFVFDGAADDDDTVKVSDWMFAVSGNTHEQFVNFESLELTESILAGSGELTNFNRVVMDGGIIAPHGRLYIVSDFVPTNTPTLVVRVSDNSIADNLRVTNSIAKGSLKANITIANHISDVEDMNAVILLVNSGGAEDIFDVGDTNSVQFNERYLLYNFTLTNSSSTEVNVVAVPVPGGELSSSLGYSGLQGIRAGFNGMKNAVFVRTRQLRRNSVATEHAISHEAYLMSSTNGPSGAYGPGDRNTIFGMHAWMEQFSGQGDYDPIGNSDGFTLNNYGTTFGFDRLFGDSLAAGINYTYARSSARADNSDSLQTETYWLGAYAEWFGLEGWFVDGLLAYGWSDYDSVRVEQDYRGVGEYSGYNVGGHLEGGRYMHYKNWALAPYAGARFLDVSSESYVEKDEANDPFLVHGTDVASFNTVLGLKLRNRLDTKRGRFQTVAYAEWAYDLINDDFSSILVDGNNIFETSVISPDPTMINAGIGLGWICTDYLEVGLGYDGRFNDNYEEHTGSVMFDVRF